MLHMVEINPEEQDIRKRFDNNAELNLHMEILDYKINGFDAIICNPHLILQVELKHQQTIRLQKK